MIVVAHSSPLIALCRIGRLELLHDLFGKLILPDAVWLEVVASHLGKADVLLMDERRGCEAAKCLGSPAQGWWVSFSKPADAALSAIRRALDKTFEKSLVSGYPMS